MLDKSYFTRVFKEIEEAKYIIEDEIQIKSEECFKYRNN